MAGEPVITLVGNLVDDPELRFTPSGHPVAKFRIASTPRTFDRQTGEWKDGEALFMTCSVWRQAAENVAESLARGMRVIVQGRLRQRSYETQDGQRRTVYEVEVDEVGPSLRYASAKVTRIERSATAAQNGDPWMSPAPAQTDRWATQPVQQPAERPAQRPTQPVDDPWATAVPAQTVGVHGQPQPDEPPF